MVSVGVTGQRVLAEVDKLEAGIDVALAEIERRFGGEPLTIVSALAEGADRLAPESPTNRSSRFRHPGLDDDVSSSRCVVRDSRTVTRLEVTEHE